MLIDHVHTHTHTRTKTHRLFVQVRPLLWKMIYSVSSATRITEGLNDWALFLLCVCVNGLSSVGICVTFTATDIVQRWKMEEQRLCRKCLVNMWISHRTRFTFSTTNWTLYSFYPPRFQQNTISDKPCCSVLNFETWCVGWRSAASRRMLPCFCFTLSFSSFSFKSQSAMKLKAFKHTTNSIVL